MSNCASVVAIVSVLCAILSDGFVQAAGHWSYDHVEKWPGVCVKGKLQSPIDLSAYGATESAFNAFQFAGYDKSHAMTITNNKHSAAMSFQEADNHPTLKGGSLPGEFVLDHMHFHWESEHTIDDRRYPLELHMVHYDSRYKSVAEAKNKKGGIAVLGILFNISPDDNTDMQQLVQIIDSIGKFPDKTVDLQQPITPKYFLPCDTAGFFRYEGSLTTPGCDEVVTWTVFTSKLTLSERQVKQFETIHSDEGPLRKNYRPIQELNDRRIQLKVSPINAGSRLGPSTALFVLISVIVSILAKLY